MIIGTFIILIAFVILFSTLTINVSSELMSIKTTLDKEKIDKEEE